MANSEMLELISQEQYNKVREIESIIEKLVKNINAANAASKNFNLPSQGKGGTSNNNSNTASANKLLAEQQRLIDRITDAKKAEAIENAKLRLELQKLTAENKKAAQEALGVMSAYQKLSAELNQLRSEAKGVAADMWLLEEAGEQNSETYRNLAATYDNLSRRVQNLNSGLTNIDRNLGDHRRNVGNYESGWNGLGNSINQLTREMPAFANSMQTGFMAISNNLPALADALSEITRENARLRAEGQPTVSALRQIASALFSWQTALSVGVTLLTVYGAKLVEWIANVNNAAKQVDILSEAQEKFNQTISETITQSEQQYNTLNQLRAVIADTTKSIDERTDASKRLASMFPGYYKSEQDILNNTKEYQKATSQLTKDILRRAEAEAKQKKAAENLELAADIQEEVDIRERTNRELLRIDAEYGGKYAEQERKRIKAGVDLRREALEENQEFIQKFGSVGQAETGALNLIGGYSQQAIRELKKRGEELLAIYRQQQEEASAIMVETSLLDYKGSKESNELQYENMVDFMASAYALKKERLENEKRGNELILEDETKSYEKRERANERFHQIMVELAQNAYNEENRLLKKNLDDEIKALDKRVIDGEITEKNRNAVVYSLQQQFQYDSALAYEKYAESIREVNRSLESSLKGVWDGMNKQKAENIISNADLQANKDYAESLNNIVSANKDYREIEKANKEFQLASRKITKNLIETEIEYLEKERNAAEVNSEARLELDNKIIEKKKELTKVTVQEAEEQAAAMAKLQKATESYLQSFSTNVISDWGLDALNTFIQVEENGKTVFQNLIDGADTMGEKFAVAFNAITEVGQQAFNMLNQNSQRNLENTLSEIDMMQRLAERFALTEEAKQEIQDQADERRREARRQQAEQEKEFAIFNAIIDTAQGVVSALSQGPQGIPLAALIGALGAAQIALISSQEIPQFKDGVRGFEGGLAIVGDGGRSEIVRTPSGDVYKTPSTDTLVNLPKGSDVFKSELDYLRNSGTLLGGMPNYMGDMKTLSKADMREVMQEALRGAATNVINIDKNGVSAYASSAGAKKASFNNFVSFKGQTFN